MYKNTTPENFQDCLTALMEQRGLSASHLAELLGYKSKTTLLRVLQGKAGMRCIGNVYTDLCRCSALQLTQAEEDRLHVAYQVELWGLEDYQARLEMWRLLRKNETEPLSMHLSAPDGSATSLEAFLNDFVPEGETGSVPVRSLEILLLSGCYTSVMHILAGILERLGKRVHITQLFMLNGDTARTVRLIRNIMPTLGYHCYEAYYVSLNDIVPDPIYSGSGTGKAMAVRAVTADGTVREYQILMQEEKSGIVLEAPGVWNHWRQFTAPYLSRATPLKAALPTVKDYIGLLEYYGETERNREILIYKSDIYFNHIPTDILLHALTDSLSSTTMPADGEAILQDLPRLRVLQEKRYQNAMAKRQPTHWVASARVLQQFARTGVLNDHFFAMRPFTGEERLRIFRHLLNEAQNNPYFFLYLLREEEEESFVDLEATYLDGVGFQLTSYGADYCLSEGWTETMLTEESFCALYKEFFMEELLVNHTCPREQSIPLLEEIIRSLESAEA